MGSSNPEQAASSAAARAASASSVAREPNDGTRTTLAAVAARSPARPGEQTRTPRIQRARNPRSHTACGPLFGCIARAYKGRTQAAMSSMPPSPVADIAASSGPVGGPLSSRTSPVKRSTRTEPEAAVGRHQCAPRPGEPQANTRVVIKVPGLGDNNAFEAGRSERIPGSLVLHGPLSPHASAARTLAKFTSTVPLLGPC